MRGTEPPQIGNPENPQSWSYTDILSAFMGLQPESAWSFSRVWSQCATQWADAVEDFAAALKTAKDASWSGPASEQAMRALSRYTDDATKLCDDFTVMEQRISGAADSIARTRSSLPATTVLDILEEDPDDRDAARAAMQNHYVAGFVAEDSEIPVLSRAQTPLSGAATIAGSDFDTSTERSSTASANADPTNASPEVEQTGSSPTTDTTTAIPAVTDPAATDAGATAPVTQLASATQVPATTESTYSATNSATAQHASNPRSTGPLAAYPSPGFQEQGGGPTGTYTGTPRSADSRKRSDEERSNVPLAALPLVAAPLAALATPNAAATTRPSMPMMPAMANPGTRATDDETAHTTPEYLITNDNGNALIGPIPKTAPPVLGA